MNSLLTVSFFCLIDLSVYGQFTKVDCTSVNPDLENVVKFGFYKQI